MRIYIKIGIALVIILIYVFRWYNKKRSQTNSNNVSQDDFKPPVEDKPISFGFKTMWFAIKTSDQNKVAEMLKIRKIRSSNWQEGLNNTRINSTFITPEIDNWVLVVGAGVPFGDTVENIDEVCLILNDLSKEFEEAQFFSTHRVVEYHCWIKSVNGQIERVYSYLGESGENIVVRGLPTEIENDYKLVNTFSEEAKDDSYFDQDDLVYPDETFIMKVAANWSVDPSTLDQRSDIKGLGLLGG